MIASWSLHSLRHRLTHEWERLVAIESAQLDDLSIQFEAVIGETRFAETDSAGGSNRSHARAHKAHVYGVQIRILQVPQFDRAES